MTVNAFARCIIRPRTQFIQLGCPRKTIHSSAIRQYPCFFPLLCSQVFQFRGRRVKLPSLMTFSRTTLSWRTNLSRTCRRSFQRRPLLSRCRIPLCQALPYPRQREENGLCFLLPWGLSDLTPYFGLWGLVLGGIQQCKSHSWKSDLGWSC